MFAFNTEQRLPDLSLLYSINYNPYKICMRPTMSISCLFIFAVLWQNDKHLLWDAEKGPQLIPGTFAPPSLSSHAPSSPLWSWAGRGTCLPAVRLEEGSEGCVGSCVDLSASEVFPIPLPGPVRLAHPSTLVWVWSGSASRNILKIINRFNDVFYWIFIAHWCNQVSILPRGSWACQIKIIIYISFQNSEERLLIVFFLCPVWSLLLSPN